MSDLVEKVQGAFFKAYDFNGIASEKMSRAAIAAVAEWLARNDGRYDACCKTAAEELKAELEQPK